MRSEMRKDCPMRHENGNCMVAGGFCTAVNDQICEALHNAYEHGWHHGILLERKSPCAACGYGGKHLEAPPCTTCPAHPKLESNHRVVESDSWIGVEDALPADNQKVLVCTRSKKMCVARWSARREKFVASGNLTVTHWMPLPEMPEVEV